MFNMFYVACNVLYIYNVLCFVEKYYSSFSQNKHRTFFQIVIVLVGVSPHRLPYPFLHQHCHQIQ